MQRRVTKLVHLLKEKKLTISLAESMTCGLASHQLSTVSGTTDIFPGSIVCYSEEIKTGILGVKKSTLKKYTAESAQATGELCKGLKSIFKTDICAAITGLASPGGSETKLKPVGTVFFAVYYKKKINSKKMLFRGSPLIIRRKACENLFDFISQIVLK